MSDPIHVSGHCYCGAITYEVDIPAGQAPIFTAYCHCDSCRRAHAAPLYQVACVDAPMFQITAGAEQLVSFTKPGGTITRAFCGTCGTKIQNRFDGWRPGGKEPLVFFPATLDEATQHQLPAALQPTKHNRPQECVLVTSMLAPLLAENG